MIGSLFPAGYYDTDFDCCWRAYQKYKGPKAASKKDASKAWAQMQRLQPPRDLMLLCIAEYDADLAKTKQAKAHMATWLRREGWMGFMADAQHRLDNPKPSERVLKPFRATDYPHPDTRPTKSAAEIIAQARRG